MRNQSNLGGKKSGSELDKGDKTDTPQDPFSPRTFKDTTAQRWLKSKV